MDSPSSRPLPADGPSAGGDEYDDIFDYDVDKINDLFNDDYVVPGTKDKDTTEKSKNGAGLGIDEEIEVTRKPRVPRVKLDEDRLLSAAGIPRLRKRAGTHLKLKGKGHEYSDTARLLAFYQLWLDDLFPKAKFLDALAMVEKQGHKRKVQMARMEWINESKPRVTRREDSIFAEPELPQQDKADKGNTAASVAPIFESTASERLKTPVRENGPDNDNLYYATPRVVRQKPVEQGAHPTSIFGNGNSGTFGAANSSVPVDDDEPPDDDLEALLAEEEELQAAQRSAAAQSNAGNVHRPEDDLDDVDAMEAMADMDMEW